VATRIFISPGSLGKTAKLALGRASNRLPFCRIPADLMKILGKQAMGLRETVKPKIFYLFFLGKVRFSDPAMFGYGWRGAEFSYRAAAASNFASGEDDKSGVRAYVS
jgi:hypothetical protein